MYLSRSVLRLVLLEHFQLNNTVLVLLILTGRIVTHLRHLYSGEYLSHLLHQIIHFHITLRKIPCELL